jgi:transposase
MATGKMNRKERKELVRQLQAANPGLEVVHARACGIDVGNSAHYAAVRPDQDPEPVRRFECFTADLHRLADWLEACGVETIAMQSTGVYWIPLYEILEERGFEVYLVNARHTKNLPGRKSDVLCFGSGPRFRENAPSTAASRSFRQLVNVEE